MNDELNEEIEALKKELEDYSNELDKLYSSENTNSQKKIEELDQKIIVLEQKNKDTESKKNSINNELSHAVHIMKKKYHEKIKKIEEVKKTEFKEESEESDTEYPEEIIKNIFIKILNMILMVLI